MYFYYSLSIEIRSDELNFVNIPLFINMARISLIRLYKHFYNILRIFWYFQWHWPLNHRRILNLNFLFFFFCSFFFTKGRILFYTLPLIAFILILPILTGKKIVTFLVYIVELRTITSSVINLLLATGQSSSPCKESPE